MKKKKHAKFKKGSLILAVQFIASLLIMFTSLKIAFLPWFYQLLLAVLLILLLGLVHKVIYPKKKEKRKLNLKNKERTADIKGLLRFLI